MAWRSLALCVEAVGVVHLWISPWDVLAAGEEEDRMAWRSLALVLRGSIGGWWGCVLK